MEIRCENKRKTEKTREKRRLKIVFKKLLNKINDRLDRFENNTKANYEIGLEKIHNENKQIYDKVRCLPDFEKRKK